MKILHLAAGNRWTGAAAPAFAEVEALRAAGIDAHYAYVGGYKLQTKLARHGFAHPIIAKAQNPISFLRTAGAIDRMVSEHHFDIVHAHLTYDHWLARFMMRGRQRVHVARTFHSRRTLRNEPFTRSLLTRTDVIFLVNDGLKDAPVLRNREVFVTPPPLDTSLFNAEGPNVRAKYGIDLTTPLLAAIGKVSKGRGFESVIETFARVKQTIANAKLMLIGHGEHRAALEEMIRSQSLTDSVIWAGYHEDDLPEHYRSADILLFTAAGSDEGHRAVIEAMACGVVPATYPIEGMETVLGPLGMRCITSSPAADALAATVLSLLQEDRVPFEREVIARAEMFNYERTARRLIDGYSTAI